MSSEKPTSQPGSGDAEPHGSGREAGQPRETGSPDRDPYAFDAPTPASGDDSFTADPFTADGERQQAAAGPYGQEAPGQHGYDRQAPPNPYGQPGWGNGQQMPPGAYGQAGQGWQGPPNPYTQAPYGQQVPPNPYAGGYYPAYGEQKSKILAGLLGIFLGGLGIHRFYLGHTNIGLVQLLGSLVGGILTLGLASFGIAIWGFVEGIMILCGAESFRRDARGIPLRD